MDDTLDKWLEYLANNDLDDPKLYNHLCKVDVERLNTLLSRLDVIDAAIQPATISTRVFNAKISRLKGKVYEKIVNTLVIGVKCFSGYTNIASTTNELDLLIQLGPLAATVPVLKKWEPLCICECKYRDTYVKNDWVSKLRTVVQTHGANVGLLFSKKGIAPQGNGAKIKHAVQLFAALDPPAYMLNFDKEDLEAIVNGHNFLAMITSRFNEVRAGLDKLKNIVA